MSESSGPPPIIAPAPKAGGDAAPLDGEATPTHWGICRVCNVDDDGRVLLLCDGCPEAAHFECTELASVPEGGASRARPCAPGGLS